MNWKFTLILLAIVAALYVFFDFYENKQVGTQDKKENETRVFLADRNQIDGLTISGHDQKIDDQKIELVRDAKNKWILKTPLADRADQTMIDQLMTNLEILRWTDKIPVKDIGKGKLADFGLQTPREHLVITAHGGHTTELLFGNETVVDGKTYLQLAGGDAVFVVGDELKKLLGKDVNSWRDHRLTDLVATDVTRFVLKNSAGEVELQKEGEHWKLVKPLAARADDTKVNDLISQLANLAVTSFVGDDKSDAASYGLSEPKGSFALYTADDPKGTELLIGNSPPETKPAPGASPALPDLTPPDEPKLPATVYARMPSRQSIYTVPSSVTGTLLLKPADLRDRSLVHVNADTVDRIQFIPAEGTPFTLAHKNKTWTILDGAAANQPADDGLINRLITSLNGGNVADFVADSATDLAKYGLDKPFLQVKLSSFASENTAETNAGDKPIATVSFGKGDESIVYARVSDEPFVVSVPKALTDQFPGDGLQWQSFSIFQADSLKVNTLDVAVKGHPTLSLTRPDKGEWTTSGKIEGALDVVKTASVVNTLARLRAMRWEGSVKPEYGMDQPTATFKFGASTDAKLGGQLVFGGLTKDGSAYGQVDGRPGVFVVSRPDYNTLTAELVPSPVPATPAAVSPTPTPVATAAPVMVPPAATPATPAPTPLATPEPTPTPAPATPVPTMAPTPAATPEPSASPVATPTPPPTTTPMPPTPEAAATPDVSAAPAPTATPTPMSTPADIPAPAATPQS